jgi:hypothetical protein
MTEQPLRIDVRQVLLDQSDFSEAYLPVNIGYAS